MKHLIGNILLLAGIFYASLTLNIENPWLRTLAIVGLGVVILLGLDLRSEAK